MAFSTFVFLTLMKLAVSLPEPDPNVKVGVDVNVEDVGGGCCKKSCPFDGMVYPDKCCLKTTCMKFCCNDGQWEYKDKFINECGMCKVNGDPHIYTFDPLMTNDTTYPTVNYYSTSDKGEFVITQPGFDTPPALFGVNADFKECSDDPSYTCVKNITYYEPGIKIKMDVDNDGKCSGSDIDPKCQIQVFVNDNVQEWPVKHSVETIFGTGGPVLLFQDNGINNDIKNFNCRIIVGTKGLSVSLCAYKNDRPHLYIWAMPDLKSSPTSELYGLCNTYTGSKVKKFVLEGGSDVYTNTDDCFANYRPLSGDSHDLEYDCLKFPTSWKV